MSKIIAFCTSIDIYKKNRIFNSSLASKYPGTQWLPILKDLLLKNGVTMVTGDVAVSKVNASIWKPKDILVIQDLDAEDGQKLIEKGSIPLALIALESPLYAYTFYKNIKKNTPTFKNRILFSHFTKRNDYTAYFPSFNRNDMFQPKNWNERKFIVMVAANKYFRKNLPLKPKYISEHYDWIRDNLWIASSEIRKNAIEGELITKRLEAIEYFGKKKLINVFGSDWNKLTNLPQTWQKKLKKIIPQIKPRAIKNKVKTISNYKFSICFENTSYPGYVTEKIIDCFVAGVIPIYLGAPDIAEFVPTNSFIDMRKFKSFQQLEIYLSKITKKEGQRIITKGQQFLKTPEGKRFSHRFMAKLLLGILRNQN